MKALIVQLVALALLGCAASNYETPDLALVDAPKSGAREALQQQPDLPNCRAREPRETMKFADAAEVSATAATFPAFYAPRAGQQYAQLDDPTKAWTGEQSAGSPTACPRSGRRHRYFA